MHFVSFNESFKHIVIGKINHFYRFIKNKIKISCFDGKNSPMGARQSKGQRNVLQRCFVAFKTNFKILINRIFFICYYCHAQQKLLFGSAHTKFNTQCLHNKTDRFFIIKKVPLCQYSFGLFKSNSVKSIFYFDNL